MRCRVRWLSRLDVWLSNHFRIYAQKVDGWCWVNLGEHCRFNAKFCTEGFAGVGFGMLLFATPDHPSNVWKLPSTDPYSSHIHGWHG